MVDTVPLTLCVDGELLKPVVGGENLQQHCRQGDKQQRKQRRDLLSFHHHRYSFRAIEEGFSLTSGLEYIIAIYCGKSVKNHYQSGSNQVESV